ncbi:deoxyguanosinetriphosphate triphosphohydrolase-like protein [Nocardioides baekrokdamisoli]|uniref:Deoxyguanosinetriphosphate triphosphohydrolase-like protein n=1 Tax=Nocardioides baekrokdamisoli TaxID=1804624 RepID=A0A3G9IJ24_9ACTN|nr:deoxyguanosinetriphosphate triphosphohydrolase [Nocardioides baekrokdamisoli]BBH16065.1 deoxyguanosinetriphosphate triphosphohydrolase-like protein [Nocardioides baekrokdamisoli]
MVDFYDDAARERWVAEPPKRVNAPERTPFERDRARVVHAASTRRLAAKTQVVGPQADDFVRNRLTHSLEVAQVARDLSRALNGPRTDQPDIAETAALAHDLGHPPFGHNGEEALNEMAADIGGFEGNAQTLRILTRLEAKTPGAGLNLTRATLDACAKYPWGLGERPGSKFGVYDADRDVFAWMRSDAPERTCVEAQIMDFADDVAYSVHDVEDGIAAGWIDLTSLDEDAVLADLRAWYLPEADTELVTVTFERLRAVGTWPTAAYTGSRDSLGVLKNLTSDLIGRFCAAVQEATFAATEGPYARYRGSVVVPDATAEEIAVLKAIAGHYVMRTPERLAAHDRERDVLHSLNDTLLARPEAMERQFFDDWQGAANDADRRRVVIDQLASLTDPAAAAWHGRLSR